MNIKIIPYSLLSLDVKEEVLKISMDGFSCYDKVNGKQYIV